uniref:Uncharacterized protein n=1 Tax=Lepeophtheirus salmonis TaxID=72036 RepID=A0A0K2UN20_LEPSM
MMIEQLELIFPSTYERRYSSSLSASATIWGQNFLSLTLGCHEEKVIFIDLSPGLHSQSFLV